MGKRTYIPLTESDKSDIIRMRKNGSTMREIAEYIGCSINTIAYHLSSATLVGRSKRWKREDDEELIRMYNAGMVAAEIGRKLGRTKENVLHRISYLRKLSHKIKYRK